jgi:hypothetical protein
MTTRKRVVEAPARKRRSAPELASIKVLVLHDDEPDTSYFDDEEFADRRAEYENGDFTFVGVRAEAEVVIDGVTQTLTSGGIWGVESDAKEMIEEHASDEWSDLRQILKTVGVSTSELPAKFDPKIIEWRA